MQTTPRKLTPDDYREIGDCVQRALAVFTRPSRVLSGEEMRVKQMLRALLAEVRAAETAAGSAPPVPDA